ncbi:hypothetical protein [Collimonas sp.]|jgi:hypothetical protein|uniref:hypothetical protein n=1 Tax=Collimonas sp. TaxID=1963772 RepID=UPI002BE38F54|nr:hypothetical protein [Collimonas sp.]HWW08599.1 hypothetical protein [Collimonas sp.]
MKKLIFCAFILPILSACASSGTDSNTASSREEVIYVTGSSIPVKRSKATGVQMISGEDAAAALRAPIRIPDAH